MLAGPKGRAVGESGELDTARHHTAGDAAGTAAGGQVPREAFGAGGGGGRLVRGGAPGRRPPGCGEPLGHL
eukprot:1181004-Prorocentrum_minimum.AAC.2